MAIDSYAFSERQQTGSSRIEHESGAATELSLFKHFLWKGKTLWGMMVHDDLCALANLRGSTRSRCDVGSERDGREPGRIALDLGRGARRDGQGRHTHLTDDALP